MNRIAFDTLIGKTLCKIKGGIGDETLDFITEDGEVYRQYHYQSCCEDVSIEDIIGDLDDLIGTPIIRATEDSNDTNPIDYVPSEYQDSFTWTFYNIATIKGHVTIRWYGSSNGYYSESVEFTRVS